jgi:hypothetical protein
MQTFSILQYGQPLSKLEHLSDVSKTSRNSTYFVKYCIDFCKKVRQATHRHSAYRLFIWIATYGISTEINGNRVPRHTKRHGAVRRPPCSAVQTFLQVSSFCCEHTQASEPRLGALCPCTPTRRRTLTLIWGCYGPDPPGFYTSIFCYFSCICAAIPSRAATRLLDIPCCTSFRNIGQDFCSFVSRLE